MRQMLRAFAEWYKRVTKYPDDYYADAAKRRQDAIDAIAAYHKWRDDRETADCDICSGRAKYYCPKCNREIQTHSHENDFICEVHEFVNPIRSTDGAIMSGDGWQHPPRVIGMTVPE